jgi:hypothetical protein
MLRAYDKATGKEVGAVLMPAPQSGSPMTYMADGKQYIVVAIGGGNYSGEYVAFTLPARSPITASPCKLRLPTRKPTSIAPWPTRKRRNTTRQTFRILPCFEYEPGRC